MDFCEVNRKAVENPRDFIIECEEKYRNKIKSAAKRIADNVKACPIILLSGPSGSGKTTTSYRLESELEALGVGTYSVSLDNYFKDFDEKTAPRTDSGEVDYESPFNLDLPLLGEHIEAMVEGREILMPKYNFAEQKRAESKTPLRRKVNEVIIIEGIHALNPMITKYAGDHGIKIYISARELFYENDKCVFKGTWTRLMRRVVRDEIFRGASAEFTLRIWDTIRVGEKKFISPYKSSADIVINSTHGYEIGVIKKYALPLLRNIPEGVARYDELCEIAPALERFVDIDEALVPKDSLIREFIGGGNFSY